MFGGVAAFGLATIVFGLSTNLALSVVALVVMGAGDMVSVYIRHLLVQLETPDAIRGRVSAVNSVFIGASNELGEFESGVTASWWGIVPAVVVGGAATLAVAAVWTRLFPAPARLDRSRQRRRAQSRRRIGARIGRVIDPVALEIGPLQLHWYGIIIASAVLIAGLLGTRSRGGWARTPRTAGRCCCS